MNKDMNNTKNNHYVPQFYLKSFCDPNNTIWKLDKTNDKIYNPQNLQAECSKKNLYTIKEKISQDDIDFLIKLFEIENNPMCINTLEHLAIFLNDEVGNLFTVTSKTEPVAAETLDYSIKKDLNNDNISRTQEKLTTELYENSFKTLYEKILKDGSINFISQEITEDITLYVCIKITSFVYKYLEKRIAKTSGEKCSHKTISNKVIESNQYYDLIIYAAFQSLRVKDVIDKFKNIPSLVNLSRFCNINNVNFAILTMNMLVISLVRNLIKKEQQIQALLVKNNSNVDFLTSDRPCINLYETHTEDRLLEAGELEFYYPLSPKLALLLTIRDCYKNVSQHMLCISKEQDIHVFNKALIKAAERYIYSNSDKLLKEYIS